MIAGVYKESGFDEVTLTPRSGDFGRDVIAIKKKLDKCALSTKLKHMLLTIALPPTM